MIIYRFTKKITIRVAILVLFSFFLCSNIYSQEKVSHRETEKLADSLYSARNYSEAILHYLSLVDLSDFPTKKASLLYNIACCLSLQGKKDSAIIFLKQAIKTGYNDKTHLLADKDLNILYNEPAWTSIAKSIKESKKVLNDDPHKAKFITTDIHRFWMAYDKALKDTLNFKHIFKKDYFDKASTGMKDYMGLKVSSIDFFLAHIKSAPKFYKAIRENSLQVDNYKTAFLNSFTKLKSIYKPAKFPDVYFVIGAFTSGGTVSDAGLLIGVNQTCQSGDVPIDEFSFRQRTRMDELKYLPNIIAHELIHYQQDGMKKDTTTLSYVIKEGMADFIGELISGSSANPTLYEWTKGKEKMIWGKFKEDMYYNRYNNWIANSQQATPDNLPDQGYWIGYQICKGYYENSKDKNQSIKEMLNIKDYKDFLEKSEWESKVEKMK